MGIALRGTNSLARASVSSPVALSLPAGTESGDVLVISIMQESAALLSIAGLTKLAQVTDTGTGADLAVFVGTSDGSTNPEVTWAGGAAKFTYGGWAAYSGVDTDNPVNASTAITFNDGFNTTPLALGPVTTTVDNCWGIAIVGSVQGRTWTPSAGWTGDVNVRVGLAHKLVTPAGSSGTESSTPSGNTQKTGMMLALQPSVPPPTPPAVPAPFADQLRARLEPWMNDDLSAFCDAIGAMFDPLLQIVDDAGLDGDPGYVPGYGVLLDVDNCPTASLPYLGQFVGVQVPSGADDATARSLIRAESGINRGTAGAIVAAAQRWLTGTQSVDLLERTAADGSSNAYHFVLVVRPEELISQADLVAAVNGVKPGGVMWTLVIDDFPIWSEAALTWDGPAVAVTWENAITGNI